MDEHGHVALPKLYGAPAYARPSVVPANPVPRPADPDDLPLVADMSAELTAELTAELVADLSADLPAELSADDLEPLDSPAIPATAPTEVEPPDATPDEVGITPPPAPAIRPRPFSIRDLAERLRAPRP